MLDARLVFSYILLFSFGLLLTLNVINNIIILKMLWHLDFYFHFYFQSLNIISATSYFVFTYILQKQKVHISHKYNILFSHLTNYL